MNQEDLPELQPFFLSADKQHQKKERQKAREIRASQWWRNQLGNGRCYYCGAQFRPQELTMDHKLPVVRGGKSTRNNLVPSCKTCNNEKKHKLLSEWLAERQAEGKPLLACAKHELY